MAADRERPRIGISEEGQAVLNELHFHENDGALPIEEQYQDIECNRDPVLSEILQRLFQEDQAISYQVFNEEEPDSASYRDLKQYLADKDEGQQRAVEKSIVINILNKLCELSKSIDEALSSAVEKQAILEAGQKESAVESLQTSCNLLHLLGLLRKLFGFSNSLLSQYVENINHDLLASINNLIRRLLHGNKDQVPKLLSAIRVNSYLVNAQLFALHEPEKNPEPITQDNIQDILDQAAKRWGYEIVVVNEIPQNLQSGKMYVCIDQKALDALTDKDAASILYMISQQLKNSSRINLTITCEEAAAQGITRSKPNFPWDKARPPIVLGIEQKEQGVQMSIKDLGIGLSYDDAIGTFSKTLAIKKEKGLATPGDLFLLAVMEDKELRVHIPEERLLREVLKRGTSIDPQGTGIGLSQLQEMVRRNDGELIVSSLPGQGFSLNIFFPKDGQSITSSRDMRIKRFDAACRELLQKQEFRGRFLTSRFTVENEDGSEIVEFYSLTSDESKLSTEELVANFRRENVFENVA